MKLIHAAIGLFKADKSSQQSGKLIVNVTEMDEFGGRNARECLVSDLLDAGDADELVRLYELVRERAAAK